MIGGSHNFTVILDDNSVYIINVKRPQFLLSSLTRRNEYLFSLYKDIDEIIIENLNVNIFVKTIFVIWNTHKIDNFSSKLNTIIETAITNGVHNRRDEMHIIGLQILAENLNAKKILNHLEKENERLNDLILKNQQKKEQKQKDLNYNYKNPIKIPSLAPFSEVDEVDEGGGGLYKKKTIRKKSRYNSNNVRSLTS
jgi:hypothetical protein